MKLKIGIAGCGAIGGSLAKEIAGNLGRYAFLSGLYDIDKNKSELLSKKLSKNKNLSVNSLKILIKKSDLVIEASSAKASWEIARKTLSGGRKIMIMSVGGIVGHLEQIYDLCLKNRTQAYFPSGAISGVDALKAAKINGIRKVVLTTTKNPKAFKGVEYAEKRFNLSGIKRKVLFSGSAGEAVKYFPQNINVAAVLGLAGIGISKTKVRIIADSSVNKNIHEILIDSKAARIFTRTENVLHPLNPKTSFLAVLSAIAALRQILQPIKIGT